MAGIRFSIKKNRLEKALLQGIELEDTGGLVSRGEGSHSAVFPLLDSGIEECPWGRFCCEMELPENTMCYLYIAASDEKQAFAQMTEEEVYFSKKKQMAEEMNGLRFVNQSDVLLYKIAGRYLWIGVEILGEGVSLSRIRVDAPGDNFLQTFPEVYQEKDSFFHRYLSIFSSIYNDFQDRLDEREQLLDLERAPVKLMELYAGWMGVDLEGGFLEEEVLRRFLKEAGELIRRKGTAWSIRRICELVLHESPVIVERGLVQRYMREEEKEVWSRLYGDSPYDVSLLISSYVDEKKREQLLHLLNQFKPIRCRLHLIYLGERNSLDEYGYLDKNVFTYAQEEGILDLSGAVDKTVILE